MYESTVNINDFQILYLNEWNYLDFKCTALTFGTDPDWQLVFHNTVTCLKYELHGQNNLFLATWTMHIYIYHNYILKKKDIYHNYIIYIYIYISFYLTIIFAIYISKLYSSLNAVGNKFLHLT